MVDTRVSSRKYQIRHGFKRGSCVRFDGGNWTRATIAASGVGLVGDVPDQNSFEFVEVGFINGLDKLTRGATYYVGTDGELTTTAHGTAIFYADSETTGHVTPVALTATSSTGEGTGPTPSSVQAQIDASIAADNARDDATYSPIAHDHDDRYYRKDIPVIHSGTGAPLWDITNNCQVLLNLDEVFQLEIDAGVDQSLNVPNAGEEIPVAFTATIVGEYVSVLWSLLSGPSAVTFDTPTALATTAVLPGDAAIGTYIFQVTAVNADGTSVTDTVNVALTYLDPATLIRAFRFGPGDYVEDSVVYSLRLVGNLLYVGGAFTSVTDINGVTVTRNKLCCINITSGLITEWNPNLSTTASHRVEDIQVDASGKLVVGGYFNTVGGVTRIGLARINADATGTLDTTFTANTNDPGLVTSLAIDPTSGDIFFGGTFSTINGTARNGGAAVSSTGTLRSFNPTFSASPEISAVLIDSGYVYFGGRFSTAQASSRPGLCAFLISTYALQASLGTWNTGAGGGVHGLHAYNGVLYIVGHFTNGGGDAYNRGAGAIALLPSTGLQTFRATIDGVGYDVGNYVTRIVITGTYSLVNQSNTGTGGTARNSVAEFLYAPLNGGLVSTYPDQGLSSSWEVWAQEISGSTLYFSTRDIASPTLTSQIYISTLA